MKVIAKRSRGAGAIFIFGAIFMPIYPIIQLGYVKGNIFLVFMLPISLFFVIVAIRYYRTPTDLIILEGTHTLRFPRGVVVDAKDIIDVTYRVSNKTARARNGTLTVQTTGGTIRLLFVADCITAGKTLIELAYNRKRELDEFT